jgi:tetratricopeptide (TPR) repeat protein
LNKIPVKVQALVSYLGGGLRDCDSQFCRQSSEAVALGIIIFYSSAGFLVGYLWARLYFEKDIENNFARALNKAWQYTDLAEEAIAKKEWPKASRLLDQALSIDRNHAKAHLRKGYVLKRLAVHDGAVVDKARLQEALEHAMEAARLDPKSAGAFYNIACYQALLGMDRTRVLGNLKAAFEEDPELKIDAVRDDDLKSIWEDPEFKTLTS